MSELRTPAAGLLQYAVDGSLADRIAEQLRMSGHGVGQAERRSWERSLPVLAQDLVDAGLGQVEILAEYQLPLTSMRVDAVLAGVHPRTGKDSYVVVELKQWSAASSFEESPRLVAVEHVSRPRLHPGLQVAGYCEYLVDFLGALHGQPHAVKGAAYLHNAFDQDINDLYELPPTEHSRIFTKQRRGQFQEFLRTHLAPEPGAGAADRLLGSAVRNGIDVLICDEAHRVRETSVNRFTPKSVRANGRPQVDELIAAARVPVFLLDEHQVVKPGELGSIDVITDYARRLGLEVDLVSLHGQFRCGGSEEYERWVLSLLGLHDDEPFVWEGDGRFDLRLATTAEQMETFLATKQQVGETARISAGYCWPWSDPGPDGTLVADVRVGSWVRPWNLKSDRNVGGAPGSAYWATDPAGFGQVGCVYTAQGFEYEWSGVIFGPDLVARDGRLVTRRSESKDPAFKSKRTVSDFEADRLIRNTYKVLLTRGMRGTMLLSTDPETQEYLAKLIHVQRGLETVYNMPASEAGST
jgi:DUF2075 family protein